MAKKTVKARRNSPKTRKASSSAEASLGACLVAAACLFLAPLHVAAAEEQPSLKERLITQAAEAQALEERIAQSAQRVKGLQRRVRQERRQGRLNHAYQQHLSEAFLRLSRRPAPALSESPDQEQSRWQGAGLLRYLLPRLREDASAIRQHIATMRQLSRQLRREQKQAAARLQKAKRIAASLERLQKKRLRSRPVHKDIARQARTQDGDDESLEAKARKAAAMRLPPPIIAAPAPLRLQRPTPAPESLRFGEKNRAGEPHRGISFQTPDRALITAPISGRVLHAGRVKGFGGVLILEARKGYHIVLAGLANITGAVGQTLHQGEPIGRMRNTDGASLYMELREYGNPIDPKPFLSISDRVPQTPSRP